MLAGYLPHHCRSICRVLGLSEFAECSGREFAARADDVIAAAEASLLEHTRREWDQRFSEAGIVAGGVHHLDEVLATGQPEARELISEVDSAAGTLQVTNNGYRINDTVFRPTGGVPRLGEQSREILGELGMENAQIEALIERGVVRTP